MSKLSFPFFLINFKAYQEGIGSKAVELAKVCDSVAKETGAAIGIAVQSSDIYKIRLAVESVKVFAQHVDPVEPGAQTGWQLAESAADNGAQGTLLNHCEHKLSNEELQNCVVAAKRAGLVTMCCAETAERAKQIAAMQPDTIAVEPPELVGGEVSVSTAKPGLITDTLSSVMSVAKIPVLAGAGIKTEVDVDKALELGADGFLVASGVVKAANQPEELKLLVNAMLRHRKI